LESWRAGVHAAVGRLPGAALDTGQKVANIQQAGSGKTAQQQAQAQKLPAKGKAAISPPPKAPADRPLIAPNTDPVPLATQEVDKASNQPLAMQTIPPLEMSPQNHLPEIGAAPPPAPKTDEKDKAGAAGDAGAKDKAAAGADASAKDPAQAHAEKTNKAAEEAPEGPVHKGPAGEIVFEAHPPPKPDPELPRPFKAGIAGALARLMVDPKGEARSILQRVRADAYGGVLVKQFPTLGDDWLDELTASVTGELDGIRAQAGISQEEIQRAVTQRQQEIEKEKAEAQGEVTQEGDAQKRKLADAGTNSLAVIAGTREQLDKSTEDKLAQAKGDSDPQVVRLRRDRLIHEVQGKVAKQVVHYEQAGKIRHTEMTQVVNLQRVAYRNAVKLDEQSISQQAGGEPAHVYPWNLIAARSRNWGDAELRKLEQLLVDKGKETDALVAGLTNWIHGAGSRATGMIREWADQKTGDYQGFWSSLLQMFEDWSAQAKAESDAWETERNKETRDALAGDMNFLGGVVMTAGEELNDQARKSIRKLGAEQAAIVMTYYGVDLDGNPVPGAQGAHNPLAAIAAGLRARMLQQRAPKIVEHFEEDLLKVEERDWPKIDALGKAQNPGFSAAHVCSEVHEALHGGLIGWNDEPRVFSALAGLTKIQLAACRKLYHLPKSQGGYDKNFDEDIHSELGGTFGQHHAERDRADALLAGDQAAADAATLREAMKGGFTGWGTDEKAIMQTLRGKSALERDKIKQAYFEKYHEVLVDDIKDELTGTFEDEHDYDRAQALLEGDTNKADAIAIDQAMYGASTNKTPTYDANEGAYRFFSGLGTDRKAIEEVYDQIRKDVEREMQQRPRDAPALTTAELEAEVKRRYEQLESSYNDTYADRWGPGNESALRRAYKDEMSGAELTLVDAIADNDLIKADAARIKVERDSIVYADDDIINGVLRHQY